MSDHRSSDILETHGADFKFHKTFGQGIVFNYTDAHKKKVRLKTVLREQTPREAHFKITSWVGVSFGAYHYYAKINLGSPHYVHAANGKPYNSGVYDHGLPFGVRRVEFEVMTRASKKHIKHDKDMARGDQLLYGRMKLGDWTHGFFTEEEAKAAAIRFFLKHFDEGWILVPDSWDEDNRPILATTVKP